MKEKTSVEEIPNQTTTIKSNPNYIYIEEKWRNSPFYIFCQANIPFISQDFDGLNYYNLLCQLVDFLNKVIHDSELVIDKTDELVELYNQLQDFVSNYFNNLDVQEEINNKLDQMAESGQLENILLNYTLTVKIYNTHQDMINDNNLVNNMKVKTLGYYSINDGGEAEYIITDILNEAKYQEKVGNLYAELIVKNGEINVKQLGAKGDNETDDYQAIQNCINNFDVVYFPMGYYYISNGLISNKDVILKGSSKLSIPNLGSFIRFNKENSTLFTGTDSAVHVEIDSMGFFSSSSHINVDSNLESRPTEPYNPYHYKQTLQNCNGILCTKKLKIINSYFTGFSGFAINANTNTIITDVWISHSNVGIRINGYDPILTRPYITLCNKGIQLIKVSATSVFMYDIWIDQIVEHAIDCASITGIITGLIDHVGYCGIHATGNARLNLNMRIGRCGMYYAGTPKENLTNEQLEYASTLYLTNIFNSIIRYTFEYRSIGTSTGVTDYMSPKCCLTVKQFIDSIFEFIEDEEKYIGCKVINKDKSNGTIITQNGIKKWNSMQNNFVDIYTLNQ